MDNTDILIVEDEAIVAADLAGKIKRLGYDISGIAANGEEAVAIAFDKPPHLILMDIRLEGPMDGIKAAEIIRNRHDIPVIYLTAHSDAATLKRAKITDPFGYILKPFEERELAIQIEMALFKHQTDRELREQREWLRVTLTSIGDAVIATDARGCITFMNPVAENLTGWKADEISGKSLSSVFRIVNEQTGQAMEVPVEKVLREGKAVVLTNNTALLTRSGQTVPIEDSAAPILDASGKVIGAVLVFHDVTEKRRSDQALIDSEQRLKRAQEIANLGSWELDLTHDQLTWSDEVFRIFGLAPRAFKATYDAFLDCVHPDDRVMVDAAYSQSITDGRDTYEIDHRIVRKDTGDIRFVHEKCEHIRDERGSIIRSLGMVHDITERKQAEETLRRFNETLERKVAERTALAEARTTQLQALAVELIEVEERERQRIADLLHDDLQQMLAAARLQLDMAQKKLPLEPILENINTLLQESISKSRRLSHELSPAILHHSGLAGVMKWLAQQMDEQFGLKVNLDVCVPEEFDYTPLKPFVFRSVHELLFNVIKHAGTQSAGLFMSVSDGNLIVTVSDDGAGFDTGILHSFNVTTGFGLLSLRERAQHMGGGLEICSTPGDGSRFTMTVPLVSKKSEESREYSKSEGDPPRANTVGLKTSAEVPPIRVLFADDHKVIRQGLIRLMNGQTDIQVVGEASNGHEALEQARQLKPDIVIMDVSMPVMNGIESTGRIKAELPEVRIIGLSMYEDDQIRNTMIQAGAETLVSKAASPAELLDTIYGISRRK